jgi:hypothetical protein
MPPEPILVERQNIRFQDHLAGLRGKKIEWIAAVATLRGG